ncbi:MAG: ABC transporter permease [Proteobacteria bacterium]|nr:ABC transporter permease [Pseudomonadota bacterium]
MFWKQIALATKNLGRNRRRNLATASAVILGYAGLVLLSGFVTRIEKFFRATSVYINHVGTLSVYKPDALEKHLLQPKKYVLTPDEQKSIRSIVAREFPEAEAVSSTLEGFTLIGNGCRTWPVRVLGIEPETEKWALSHPAVRSYSSEIIDARKGTGLWQHSDTTPIAVTAKVARNLGKTKIRSLSDQTQTGAASQPQSQDCAGAESERRIAQDTNVQLAARTFNNDFSAADAEIVGHYSSGLELLEESAAVVPLAALQKLYETDGVTNVIIHLPWGQPPENAAAKLRQALVKEGLSFNVHHYRELSVNPFYAGFMSLIYVMSVFFLTLAVSVVTLTVSDSMTMSVIERSQEMGTLRALGFRQKDITRMFAIEGLLLALLCLPAGFLIAYLTRALVNANDILFEVPGVSTRLKMTLMIDPVHCLVAGSLLLFVSTLSGWLTSYRNSRLKIVSLLNTHVS